MLLPFLTVSILRALYSRLRPMDPTFNLAIASLPADVRARTRSTFAASSATAPTSLTMPSESVDHYVVSPEWLSNVDRQLIETISKTVDSIATRNALRASCSSSGRELIRTISRQADNAPTSAGMTIETMMQAHFDNGLAENTFQPFNAFHHEYDRFNRSLPAHQRLLEGVIAAEKCPMSCAGSLNKIAHCWM
eukprot:4015969-Pleurochrysis_carterae.AAC.1